MSVRKREWTTGKGEARTAWVVDYTDGKGVRRLKTFAKKKDADAFAATTHVEVRQGTHVAEGATQTLTETVETWIASAESRGLERATVDNYRRLLELHVKPFIGREKLSKLNVPTIRAFEDSLRSEGRSSDLVKKVLVALGMLLADAQERGLVARNAVRDMRGRRKGGNSDRHKSKPRVGVDIPSPDEIRSLFRALARRRFAKWRPLIVAAALTGLRASELRGLRWQDVDLDRGELHVRQRADRFGTIGSLKSKAGERAVPITPQLADILREWQLAYPRPVTGWEECGRKRTREAHRPEHLVFPNGNGNVEMLTNILRRGLWPACEAAGLTVKATTKVGQLVLDEEGKPVMEAKYSMHALRHWFASWCINAKPQGLGLPPKVVQERLGHSTIAMTMDTYSHLFPRGDDADELAAAEQALFV
jgi:integrase